MGFAAITVPGPVAWGETLHGLRDAIQGNDIAGVDRLLAQAPPGQHDQDAATALIAAAYYGKTGLIDHLLASGVPATAADARGWTALMSAVKGEQPDAVDLLLSHGADPAAHLLDGGTSALTLAAGLGHTAILERLRRGGPAGGKATADLFAGAVQDERLDVIRQCLTEPGFRVGGRPAQRALLLAIQRDDGATAIALLDHGASADEPADAAGPTPLMAAASSDNRADLVRALLERGADPGRIPPMGADALGIAIDARAVNVARLLIQDNTRTHRLPMHGHFLLGAIGDQEPALVDPLVAAGVDVNYVCQEGFTPLMWAVERCREAVDPLLAHHPRLDLRDHDGRSVFERPGGAWLADKMRRAGDGAQVDAVMSQPRRDKAQLTAALLAAVKRGDVNEVRTLLDAGATPQACNRLDWPVSVLAAQLGHTDIVRLLYERDPSTVHQTSPNHWGTMLEAAGSGHLDTVRFLLACHLEPDACDDHGNSAAEYADERGYKEVAALLRAAPRRSRPPHAPGGAASPPP